MLRALNLLCHKLPFIVSMLGIVFSTMGFSQNVAEQCADEVSKKHQQQYELARGMYQKGKRNDAKTLLRDLLKAVPEYPAPAFLLGVICAEEERPVPAMKYFQMVLEHCPDFTEPLLHYYLGIIYYTNNDFAQAETHLQKFFQQAQDQASYENLYAKADEYLSWSEFLHKTYNNPVPFSAKPVSNVCSVGDEYLPYITIDNSQLFFTRKAIFQDAATESFYQKATGERKERFMRANRQSNQRFDAGEVLPYPFNERGNEGGATLSADNRELVYTVCQPMENYFNCDLYYSKKINAEEWSPLVSLGNSINNMGTWEAQPSLSPDGKTLYFASDRPGGFGGLDIWKTHRLSGGNWSTPENLGKRINSSGNEKSPFIHPDGQTLYFSSDGWKGLGGYDIFYSRLNDDKQKEPLNIGYPINSEKDDLGFIVSSDGKTAYFASNIPNESQGWDIFSFDLYPEAQPSGVRIIRGSLLDEKNQPVEAVVDMKKLSTGETSTYTVDSVSGTYTAVVNNNEDYLMTVKKVDYAFESKFIHAAPSTANIQQTDLHLKPIAIGGNYQINDIYFATASYELTKESKFVIDAFVDFLRENPSLKISIEGHTDNIGGKDENQHLSEQRAKSVYDYVVFRRIQPFRLSYKGWGSDKPVADNNTEEGRTKNRRTLFIIVDK